MLRGVKTKWKQTIAWHICPKKNDDEALFKFIKEIIQSVEAIGYKIHGILSDMGSKNLSLWKNFNVKVNRENNQHFIPHPTRMNANLYFMADVPHLLKNLKSMFVAHDFILADEIVEKYNLGSNLVKSKYVKMSIDLQEEHSLKLTPNLNHSKLEPSNNFDKMNVGFACAVFHNSVAASLVTLVELEYMPKEALTTAWFIRKVREWWNIFNPRIPSEGITIQNSRDKIL